MRFRLRDVRHRLWSVERWGVRKKVIRSRSSSGRWESGMIIGWSDGWGKGGRDVLNNGCVQVLNEYIK